MKLLWLSCVITIGLIAYWTDTQTNQQKKNDKSWTTEFAEARQVWEGRKVEELNQTTRH